MVGHWKLVFVYFIILAATMAFILPVKHVSALSGSGTSLGDPFLVTTCLEFSELSNYAGVYYSSLQNDLDCSSSGENIMVGSSGTPYSGNFNGNGHTIIVDINSNQDSVGLFRVTASANIYDLKVEGSVVGKNSVGGIIGYNGGATELHRVASFVTVGVYPDVGQNFGFGGLVGKSGNGSAFQNVRIYDSYNAGTVGELSTDINDVGGLVGYGNYLIIENSYNRGELFGKSPGELAGFNVYTYSLKNNFAVGYINYADSAAKTLKSGGIFSYLQYAYDAAVTTNNHFDKSRTKAEKCWQNITTIVGKCETQNNTWNAPSYFKGNSTNLPFINGSAVQVWDFTSVWETVTDGYPALRSIVGDEIATTNDNPGVPATPTGLYIPLKNTTSAKLFWTNNNNKYMDTAYFNVEYKKTTDSSWTVIDTEPLSLDILAPNLEITGLDPVALYEVKVKALNAQGQSEYSEVLTFSSSVPNVLPSAPTNVVVIPQGNPLIVDVDWDAPAVSGDYPITGYKIQVKYSTSTWEDLIYESSISGPATIVTGISGLRNSLMYDFRIVANTIVGFGAFSGVSSHSTPLATTHLIKNCTNNTDEENFGLLAVDDNVLFRDDSFKVANDIDCTGVSFVPLAYAMGGTQFEGILDGQNFTISNVNISTFNASDNGLFARVKGAVIKNLHLEISAISVNAYSQIGALAGSAYGYTHVNNVDVEVTISTSGTSIGGLFGYFADDGDNTSLLSISDSSVTGTIVNLGRYNIGGLVGVLSCDAMNQRLNCAFIQNNSISMDIEAGDSIGGLIGFTRINENVGLVVSANTFSGNIDTTVAGWAIGGLFGEFSPNSSGAPTNPIIISNNTTSGMLNAQESAGGIIGYYGDNSEGVGIVFDSNTSSILITGGAYLGGLIGSVENYYQYSSFDPSPVSITNSSYTGSVIGDVSTGYTIGGLVGYADVYNMTIQKCFSTGNVSGNEYIGGLLGEVYSNVSIIDSYSTGNVTATSNTVGGLVSYFYGDSIDYPSVIYNSYATGVITGGDTIGGLVGVMDWKVGIENSFFDGTITATAITPLETGSIIGVSYNPVLTFVNVSYNTFKTSPLECVGNPDSPSDFTPCLGINVADATPNFYRGNITNEPMASWNTVSVWRRMPNDYPKLRWHTANATAPILTLMGSSTIVSTRGVVYSDEGATAADDYDGDITSDITVINPVNINVTGTYNIQYNVCDSDLNCANEITRRVDVVTDPPVITLVGASVVSIKKGTIYVDAGATAVDDFDGDLTSSILVTNNVNKEVVGSYSVLYNVCDADGNCAVEKSRQVNVAATDQSGVISTNEGSAPEESEESNPKTIILNENANYLAGMAVPYSLSKNDKVIAQIEKLGYELNIAEVGDNYVMLARGKGENVLIEIGKMASLDLNEDDIFDVVVSLTGIMGEKSELTFQMIRGETVEVTMPPTTSPTPIMLITKELKKNYSALLWGLLIIPIVLVWSRVKMSLTKGK